MLYTVIPLEKIYADPRRNDTAFQKEREKQREPSKDEYRDIPLQHGRLTARRDGENYVIERINSTDMSDYLNEEYAPGKTIEN
ncbi:MAG: hypothetical protein K0S76_1931 [Herbinix sp.]|jgi:hypothetical protein|nr:hypothetical protein [Herbinix sp.]